MSDLYTDRELLGTKSVNDIMLLEENSTENNQHEHEEKVFKSYYENSEAKSDFISGIVKPMTFNPVVVEPSKKTMEESTDPDSKSPPTMQEIVNEAIFIENNLPLPKATEKSTIIDPNFQQNQENNLPDNAKMIKQEYVPDVANENTNTNWATSWPFKFFLRK